MSFLEDYAKSGVKSAVENRPVSRMKYIFHAKFSSNLIYMSKNAIFNLMFIQVNGNLRAFLNTYKYGGKRSKKYSSGNEMEQLRNFMIRRRMSMQMPHAAQNLLPRLF